MDSLIDDDGQTGAIGQVNIDPSFVSKDYSEKIVKAIGDTGVVSEEVVDE